MAAEKFVSAFLLKVLLGAAIISSSAFGAQMAPCRSQELENGRYITTFPADQVGPLESAEELLPHPRR